jgi:HTH-type transcriptional regulator, competence development regulator
LANFFEIDIEILKNEYFGDRFARKMFEYNCSSEVLTVAEEKIKYLKEINIKQAKITF